MNHRFVCVLFLCLSVTLILTGCIPVTGTEDSVPASVTQTQDTILTYLTTSSRLAPIPPSMDWQLDSVEQLEGEYHFHSGDWHMVIHLANGTHENQQIVIINLTKNAYWCGYLKSDGQVVDTTYNK
jgi:hypothetical protein